MCHHHVFKPYTKPPLPPNTHIDPDQILASTAAQTPLQRNATPHDIAAAVVFLCSNSAASFITGTTLSVDGGFSLMHPLCMSYLKPSCGDEEAVDTPQGGGG